MYAFSHSPPGQGVMPTNLLSIIAPRMEPSYTQSSQLSTVPLPDNCVMIPVFQDAWLSAFPIHLQTFKPTQASFAHTNSQLSHSMSYKIFLEFFLFFIFKCWRISSSSTQPIESAARPLQRAAGLIKGTRPPC